MATGAFEATVRSNRDIIGKFKRSLENLRTINGIICQFKVCVYCMYRG